MEGLNGEKQSIAIKPLQMQKLPVVKMNQLKRFIQAQKRIFGKSLTQTAMDMTAMTQNIYHKCSERQL